MRHRIPLQHPGLALFAAVGFASCGIASLSRGKPPEGPDPTPEQITFFETKVRPVLAKNCYSCHGPTSQTAGLRLDTPDGLAKADAISGNDPEKSSFVHAIRYTGKVQMPPAGKLKPNEIADLEAWVKMGAPWPKAPAAKRKQDEFLWSLQPVKKPALPNVKNAAWVKNPIDTFILAKLEANKLTPAAPADRRTLLRRVTYDLIGLPPSAAETEAFVADKSPNAYEKVVDRLLASPRYGERWARQWLDVARYADTKGYVFNEDRNYPNAYNYRAWVIDAFNHDLPYDQFVTDQLAADRVTDPKADDQKALAALGFITLGRRFLNDTPSIIDDRIDVTMRGFQGFTVACARCHDHKFDPIPTQDYYSLYAVFNSSEERTVPISERAIREPWEKFNARIASNETNVREIVLSEMRRLRTVPDLPANLKGILAGIREETPADGDNLNRLAAAFTPEQRTKLQSLQKDSEEARKNMPPTPELAMSMVDRGNGSDGVVFKRGNPGNPGDAAPRRFLLALCSPGKEREHWTAGSGRLELAKSIASKDNPLTARVFVNRIWMGHFGAGIVRTPSDFGHQGEKPTHPELLDYLASTFMENGWSIKKLHRQIVLSATYRQSSDTTVAAINADPDNRLLNRMSRKRLDLEQMRDTLMAASGRLDTKQVGGHSVDLWSEPFSPRRAVYGFVERQNLPGIFRTFDFASPDSTSPRRFQTTVPQQALFFLNSPLAVETARNVATRPELNGADDAKRIRLLYRILLDRLPDADEAAAGAAYLRGPEPAAVQGPWQYGYGSVANGKVASFTPLAVFRDGMYRVGNVFPDPNLGYLTLNAVGGHPGRDEAHAIIRRWTAPAAMSITIKGRLEHGAEPGDGVRARIVSSRSGTVGEWKAHHGAAATDVGPFSVQKGDTIDFVVDPQNGDNSDGFNWNPTVTGVGSWSASANFGGPPPPPLSRMTLYVQALMMTNEFVFVD